MLLENFCVSLNNFNELAGNGHITNISDIQPPPTALFLKTLIVINSQNLLHTLKLSFLYLQNYLINQKKTKFPWSERIEVLGPNFAICWKFSSLFFFSFKSSFSNIFSIVIIHSAVDWRYIVKVYLVKETLFSKSNWRKWLH